MCGIYGRFHLEGQPVDVGAVFCATQTMRHRGPDDEGYLFFNLSDGDLVHCGDRDTDVRVGIPGPEAALGRQFDLAFGFRRLSIIDLSPAAHQPMCSADGRYWIIYNGEVYNFPELRDELVRYGYTFRSASDTEVILAAFERWGAKTAFNKMNGMWGLAIWDTREKELILCRDRFGIKPLYYTWQNQQVVFASEIKALVGSHGVPFNPDTNVINRYLATGNLPDAHTQQTFMQGVYVLPPAHLLRVRPSGIQLERYWSLPPYEEKNIVSLDRSIEDFGVLFEDAVRFCLRSDVPVGSCLSGGLDSSAIVMTIQSQMSGSGFNADMIGDCLRTFSAVYHADGPHNEVKYVERLLKHSSIQKNLTYPDVDKLQNDASRLVWAQEEPFPSTSIFAQWCVMQMAREKNVTVLLDGQGADEMMGGYRPFSKYFADFIQRGWLLQCLREARSVYRTAGRTTFFHLAAAFAYAFPVFESLGISLEHIMHSDTSVLRQRYKDENHLNALRHYGDSPYLLDRHLRQIFEDTNLPNLLRYEDRNSMAFSIEARVPYLDYRLVEQVFGQAAFWRIYNGWTKYILRKSMEKRVPPEILWRKDKIGFATPEESWMKDWMKASYQDIFADHALSGEYLKLQLVRERIHRWLTGHGRKPPVWRWINLELWLKGWSAW